MTRSNDRSAFVALGLLTLSLFAAPAHAEVIVFTSVLNAKAEVPPNPSTATGSAEVRLDTSTRGVSWVIEFSGLTGPLTAAHFHGPAGGTSNAGITVPIARAGAGSPIVGGSTLTEQQIQDLVGGRWYINLHTGAHPGGEIRGQVIKK